MLEGILTRRHVGMRMKITVKALVSAGIIALAVILPQLVHLAAGATGGAAWLPMYLPVLIGGCLLGPVWGLSVGVLSPIVSFLCTLAFGNPMPAASRLPYMIVELAVFAAVSGAFSKIIAKNKYTAFLAVPTAFVAGRATFLLLAVIFQTVSPLSFAMAWAQVQSGLIAAAVQCVIVPAVVIVLSVVFDRAEE